MKKILMIVMLLSISPIIGNDDESIDYDQKSVSIIDSWLFPDIYEKREAFSAWCLANEKHCKAWDEYFLAYSTWKSKSDELSELYYSALRKWHDENPMPKTRDMYINIQEWRASNYSKDVILIPSEEFIAWQDREQAACNELAEYQEYLNYAQAPEMLHEFQPLEKYEENLKTPFYKCFSKIAIPFVKHGYLHPQYKLSELYNDPNEVTFLNVLTDPMIAGTLVISTCIAWYIYDQYSIKPQYSDDVVDAETKEVQGAEVENSDSQE